MRHSTDERGFLNEIPDGNLNAYGHEVNSLPGDILYMPDGVGKLERLLSQFHSRRTIESCAALLTIPGFQAATPRLECLVHLAAANCAGKRKPTESDLARWMNRNLLDTPAYRLEDPAEDVFIGNVCTNEGNYRIFQDTYPYNDCYLSTLLSGLSKFAEKVQPLHTAIRSAHALLWLSEQVCERLGLERWTLSMSDVRSNLTISQATKVALRAKSLTFKISELSASGFDVEMLAPFLLDSALPASSDLESVSRIKSPLRLRPLIKFGDEVVVALPNGLACAARRFLTTQAEQFGITKLLSHWLAMEQCKDVLDCIARLGVDIHHNALPNGPLPNLDSFDFLYERGHYVHLLVLHDCIANLLVHGDYSVGNIPPDEEYALKSYVLRRRLELEASAGFEQGTLMVIFGGTGRCRTVSIAPSADTWDVVTLDTPDINLLLKFEPIEFRRLMKAQQQVRWLRSTGVDVQNPSGSFGQYSFLTESHYKIVPRALPLRQGAIVSLLGNDMAVRRQQLRKLEDQHVVRNHVGQWVPVARYARDSFFAAHAISPLYVSPQAAQNGVLAAVAISKRHNRWLIFHAEGSTARENALYIWSNFVHVFCDLVEALESVTGLMPPDTLEIHVDVGNVREMGETGENDEVTSPFDIVVRAHKAGISQVVLPPNFYDGFFRVDNKAERTMLSKLGEALVKASSTLGGTVTDAAVAKVCDDVLPLGGGRLIHIFPSHSAVDHLLNNTDEKPTLVDEADLNFSRIGLSLKDAGDEARKFFGKSQCRQFLNDIVESTWQKIRSHLQRLDRQSLLIEGFRSIEAIHADNSQWRSSAQAVLTLHGADSVHAAFKRDQDRSRTSLATRVLLEMAICECPPIGALHVAHSEYEMLLALVSVLIEVAYDSDAVNGDLTKPEVVVFPNGEYSLDRSYQQTIMHPFVSNQFAGDYHDAAKEYVEKVQRTAPAPSQNPTEKSPYSTEFTEAFKAEYELSPIDLLECCSELMDLAVVQESPVVVTTIGEIRQRLIENRSLTGAICDAFIKNFCLHSRAKWDITPDPFKFRDIAPWMYRRRLSIVTRPVLIDGTALDNVATYGLGQLVNSWNYAVTRAEMGRLPHEFFDSRKMRAYIGFAANRNGAAFEEEVAAELRLAGWQATTRVMMTALGGTDAQGDVDVLAWHSNGNILAIECKWLQQARTVREVAEVLTKFAGEERDNLDKHLARIAWLNQNSGELRRRVGAAPAKLNLLGLLVTDNAVPMMYVKSLPISPNDVVPLRNLVARIADK